MSPRSGAYWAGGGASGGILIPAAGGGPTCSFTMWSGPSTNSSPDVWSAHISGSGAFVPSATPPTVAIVDNGDWFGGSGAGAYGTPDVTLFGVRSGVPGSPATIDLRWVFDTQGVGGIPIICTYMLRSIGGSGGETFGWSDDGAAFTSLGVPVLGTPTAIADLRHRYWWFRVQASVPAATFYNGNDYDCFSLWAAH